MIDRTAKPIWEESWFCKLLILASAVAWGVSFFVLKGVIAEFPVFFVLVFRFMVSGLLLLVIFRKSVRKHLDAETVGFGVVLGVLFWAGYAFQTFGLEQTTPGKNAFITATYCVLVPFFAWMLGMGKPKTNNIVGAVLCLVGLGFVALDGGFPLNQGDVLTFGCAVTYGLMYALIS